VTPDFIIVDGAEGGTAAAPLEYEDNIGLPLTDGLMIMNNALVGTGLRDRIRIGGRAARVASGKRHHQAPDSGRRLHQLRPVDDDGGGLHPIAAVSHQTTARSASQLRIRIGPVPSTSLTRVSGCTTIRRANRHAGHAHDGLDGCLGPVDAQPAHAAQADIAHRTTFVTPSFTNGSSLVCCWTMRRPVGGPTGRSRTRTATRPPASR